MTPQRRAAVETPPSPAAPPGPPATPVASGPGTQSPAGGEPSANADGTSAPPAGSRALSAGQLAIAAAMSEDRGPDSLDAHLRQLMKDLGLTGFHVEKSLDVEKNRKNVSVRGWPDWSIRGARGVIFRELKSQRGRVEPDQQAWLDALGGDVWRPSDLLSGKIAAELVALAGLRGAQ